MERVGLSLQTGMLIVITYVVLSIINLISCLRHIPKVKHEDNPSFRKLFIISFVVKLIPWAAYLYLEVLN